MTGKVSPSTSARDAKGVPDIVKARVFVRVLNRPGWTIRVGSDFGSHMRGGVLLPHGVFSGCEFMDTIITKSAAK